jgi:hypothetical protein
LHFLQKMTMIAFGFVFNTPSLLRVGSLSVLAEIFEAYSIGKVPERVDPPKRQTVDAVLADAHHCAHSIQPKRPLQEDLQTRRKLTSDAHVYSSMANDKDASETTLYEGDDSCTRKSVSFGQVEIHRYSSEDYCESESSDYPISESSDEEFMNISDCTMAPDLIGSGCLSSDGRQELDQCEYDIYYDDVGYDLDEPHEYIVKSPKVIPLPNPSSPPKDEIDPNAEFWEDIFQALVASIALPMCIFWTTPMRRSHQCW